MSETPRAESSSAQSAALKNEAKRWEGWPKNCTNYRPGLDDPHELQQMFTRFEENKPPISPSEWQVFHINEYGRSGKELINHKVNEKQLASHLETMSVQRLLDPAYFKKEDSGEEEEQALFHCFFGCSQFTEETQASTYARRLYSFCEAPMGVALTFWSAVMLGFKWHQEPSKVYHAWLKCPIRCRANDRESDLDYYSEPMAPIQKGDEEYLTTRRDPAIYLRYNPSTGECIVVTYDIAAIHRTAIAVCKEAPTTRPDEDPFIFFVAYLTTVLNGIKRAAEGWMILVEKHAATAVRVDENIPDPLVNFTLDHRILTRAGKALEGITEAIATIQEEHRRFAQEIKPIEQYLFNSMHQSLAELKRTATELRREMEYMAAAVSKSIDVALALRPKKSKRMKVLRGPADGFGIIGRLF